MQYKVPQNVQREDTILWFITLRQFIILAVGFGISYFLLTQLRKNLLLNQLEYVLIFIPAGISLAFAFLKVRDISLFRFILLLLEQFGFRARQRYFIPNAGTPFVSLTRRFVVKKTDIDTPLQKRLATEEDIHKLASVLDTSSH